MSRFTTFSFDDVRFLTAGAAHGRMRLRVQHSTHAKNDTCSLESAHSRKDSGLKYNAIRRYHDILPGFPVHSQCLGYRARIKLRKLNAHALLHETQNQVTITTITFVGDQKQRVRVLICSFGAHVHV